MTAGSAHDDAAAEAAAEAAAKDDDDGGGGGGATLILSGRWPSNLEGDDSPSVGVAFVGGARPLLAACWHNQSKKRDEFRLSFVFFLNGPPLVISKKAKQKTK